MNKVKLIQFLPYFPPHRGGLEMVAEELSSFYVSKNYGEIVNVTFDVGQDLSEIDDVDLIKNKSGNTLGYRKAGYIVYLLPSFDLIFNFPFPKFWQKSFWQVLKMVRGVGFGEKTIIQTHTRFFLSSFLGGIFARHNNFKWVHIEHGSDYVKLGSAFKSQIAYLYDKIIGKWIFKKADTIIAISQGVKDFVRKEFVDREIALIYNGIHFHPGKKIDNGNIIRIGFVGRLVKLKGVDILLEVFKNLSEKYPHLELSIVGDGDEKEKLEKYISKNNFKNVDLLGSKNRAYISNTFLPKIDILVNPSFQEGLPTSVLEGLIAGCVIVATNVGGTREISDEDDLIIIEKGSINELEKGLEKAIIHYKSLRGNSASLVKVKFDWDNSVEKYFHLYQKL